MKTNKKMYIARSPRIAARMLGKEMLVMSAQGSTLFTLNPTATVLWQAADGATLLDEIVERRICAEFDVKPEDAMRDAEELADKLAKHGILLISEQPISGQPISGQPIAGQMTVKTDAPVLEPVEGKR
jgi:hypothetical protein